MIYDYKVSLIFKDASHITFFPFSFLALFECGSMARCSLHVIGTGLGGLHAWETGCLSGAVHGLNAIRVFSAVEADNVLCFVFK